MRAANNKKAFLSNVFQDVLPSKDGSEISVRCPFCGKPGKSKMCIIVETDVYHCWVCETKGKNIARFVQINYPNNKQIDRFKEYFGGFREEVLQQEISLSLPDDFKLLATDNSRQSNFIKKYLFKN